MMGKLELISCVFDSKEREGFLLGEMYADKIIREGGFTEFAETVNGRIAQVGAQDSHALSHSPFPNFKNFPPFRCQFCAHSFSWCSADCFPTGVGCYLRWRHFESDCGAPSQGQKRLLVVLKISCWLLGSHVLEYLCTVLAL